MTRETRVAMLVGLLFIVMFGLVLAELTGQDSTQPAIKASEKLTARHYAPILDRSVVENDPYVIAHERRLDAAQRLAVADEDSLVEIVPIPPGEYEVATISEDSVMRFDVSPSSSDAHLPPVIPMPQVEQVSRAPAGQRRSQTIAGQKVYKVEPGDTLIAIARKHYGRGNEMEYTRILQANSAAVKDERSLRVGQELVIPPFESACAPAVASARQPRSDGVEVLDLDGLARRFSAGDAATAGTRAPRRRVHVVRKGDNLSKIAREVYNDNSHASVMKIYNANKGKLSSPDRLMVGMELEIPS